MDTLFPVTAAPVRSFDIDGFDQIVKYIAIQLVDSYVGLYLLNELFKAFLILFLYFDFVIQSINFSFQLLLLCLITGA